MHDWDEYRGQIVADVAEIGKLSADIVKRYVPLLGEGCRESQSSRRQDA